MVLRVTHSIFHVRLPERLRLVRDSVRQGHAPQRAQRGFTLVETLVALLIVVMLSAVIAMGAPSAIRAYQSTVAKSNAQTVLATMTTALRDELGSATAVMLGNESSVSSYMCGEGYVAKLVGTKDEIDKINEKEGQHHRGPVKEVDDGRLGTQPSWSLVPDAQVVSTQNDLYVTFDSIEFDESTKSFTVNNLGVYQGEDGNLLASIAEGHYSIRSPYCEVVTKWPWES